MSADTKDKKDGTLAAVFETMPNTPATKALMDGMDLSDEPVLNLAAGALTAMFAVEPEGDRHLRDTCAAIQQVMEQVAEDPGSFDDIDQVYTVLSVHFDKANKGTWCPCGSGATFGGCCKTRWLPAHRAYEAWKKEPAVQEKADVKHAKKVAGPDVMWFGIIGMGKDGGPMVGAPPGKEQINMPGLIDVLPVVWAQMIEYKIRNNLIDEINAISQHGAEAEMRQQASGTPPRKH